MSYLANVNFSRQTRIATRGDRGNKPIVELRGNKPIVLGDLYKIVCISFINQDSDSKSLLFKSIVIKEATQTLIIKDKSF